MPVPPGKRPTYDSVPGDGDDFNDLWDKTQAAEDGFDPLPAGVYRCLVHEGRRWEADSGTKGYRVTFVVLDGEHANRRLWHFLWLTARALPMTKRDLKKLAIDRPEQMDRPLPSGIIADVRVGLRTEDDTRSFNRVIAFKVIEAALPPGALDTDDQSLFEEWRSDVLSIEPPTSWSIGDPTFDHVEVAPGRIVLVGGSPSSGKTALLQQWVGGILDAEADARVLIANIEMAPGQLLNRMLSRTSGVPLTDIRKRQVKPTDIAKLGTAMERIRSYGDRLAFASAPNSLAAVRAAAAAHWADILCLDYVQRIEPTGNFGGLRDRINALMSELRSLANSGAAILAASALARSRDDKGRASYSGQHLSVASFRESSELEYGCDSAFLLVSTVEADKRSVQSILLKHEKNRDGETRDTALTFDRRVQRFELGSFLDAASSSGALSANRASRRDWSKAARDGKSGGPVDEKSF
jgi:replicative DNA helicase